MIEGLVTLKLSTVAALSRVVSIPSFLSFGSIPRSERPILNETFNAHSSSSLFVGSDSGDDEELDQGGVTHHSPTQVLQNFKEISFLRIELPNSELGIDDGVLLKWRADFESTLENRIILGASFVINNVHLQVSKFGNDGFCNYSNCNTLK
ncbi:hypothetical protein V6N13_113382 [Hibiscus sabdariffa]